MGTSLVTGSGAPTCSFVYKLVARATADAADAPVHPVAKLSVNKGSVGGRKFALRRLGPNGRAQAEVIGIQAAPEGDWNDRPLLVQLVDNGEVVGRESLEAARKRHRRALAELPASARKMSRGEPVLETIMLDAEGRPTLNPYATKEA